MSEKAETLEQIAKAIPMDVRQLRRESKTPGFPKPAHGKRYHSGEVTEWRRGNISPRPTRRKTERRAAVETTSLPLIARPDSKEITDILTSGKATALDISRAVVQLVSRQVAKNEMFCSTDLDALKKALGELRQAESDYMELSEKQGRMIERDVVKQIVGTICARLVRCLGVLENAITTEFSIWLADPAIAVMPSDGRARKVREFVAKTCYEVRKQEADEIDKLVEQAKVES